MARPFVTFFFLIVSVWTHAQQISPCDSLIDALARRNYVTGSRIVTGLYDGPLKIDPQYDDYEHLLPSLQESDVADMFRHDSLAVAAFAFMAATDRFPRLVIPLLRQEAAQPRPDSFPNFLNTCQGTIQTTLIDFMIVESWVKEKCRTLDLSEEEICIWENIRMDRRAKTRLDKKAAGGF